MLTDNLPSRTLSVDVFARADRRLIAQGQNHTAPIPKRNRSPSGL